MKQLKWLDHNIEKVFLVAFLVVIVVINVIQIIIRIGFQSALPWVEELSRYMLIWSGFLGVSYTLRYNTAMRLTLIFTIVPRKARNVISMFVYVVMLVFFIWIVASGISLMPVTTQSSASMGFSMRYVYFCSVLCGVLSSIRCVQSIVRIVSNFADGDDSQWDPQVELQENIDDKKGDE